MLNKEEIEIQLNAISDIMFLLEENLCEIMKQKIDKVRKYIKQLEKEKEESYWQGYIKKQQESIEICKICKYRENYRQKEAELSKASKIIDEMTKEINKATSEKYKIKHICEAGKCEYEECHEDNWNECIKQYFENKVEGGKNE